MLQFSRSLAHQLRAVFRKLASRSTANIAKVSFTASSKGLQIRLHRAEILGEYQQEGEYSPAEFIISLQTLADFEGRNGDQVTFETADAGIVQARWEDDGVPQVKSYEAEEPAKLPAYPSLPKTMTPVEPSILKVLAEASLSVSHDNIRYAITNIQLKGSVGAIIATDGHQLLQMTFPLPWSDDVLVPASAVFGCKELQHEGSVCIGKSDNHVSIQAGPWTLHLPIDKDGRFPKVETVIPKQEEATAHCRLHPEDCAFLAKAIDRLPGAEDDDAPITLDLNREVRVRAKANDQKQTVELALNRSEATGAALRLAMNRKFLARAVELGLTEFCATDSKKPILFHGDKCKFVVMPLTEGQLLPASQNAIRIVSTKEAQKEPVHTAPRSKIVNETHDSTTNDAAESEVPQPTSDGKKGTRTRKAKNTGLATLIQEAESLKDALRQICGRSHDLVVALKRHRKQSRLVQSSLKALKDLQNIGA
jgi:hypothetical protein